MEPLSGPGRPSPAAGDGRPGRGSSTRTRRGAVVTALLIGLALTGVGAANLTSAPGYGGPAAVRDIGELPSAVAGEPAGPEVLRAPPTRLRIPRIGVDTALTDLQVQGDGHLATPDDPNVAGWWSQGPAPGSPGAAVIVGHVDSLTGPAVFAGLSVLRPGDTITVEGNDGTVTDFTVQALRTYAKDDFPDGLVFEGSTVPSLRLITCGGTYDRDTREYLSNLVVFAVPTKAPGTDPTNEPTAESGTST
ncbi:class F sortase [Streptomyces sp. NRRL B-24484]|uniref:class F sortase n=1 Tax=Streptomyces sp. NRRL B-24484 TaxID=1463833 RepID=UPI0009962F8C|nr:class F sortase [Streptomyces sp. NRRL B-24484]